MTVAAERLHAAPVPPPAAPPLRLAPRPRSAPTRGDGVWAMTLAALLAVGIVAVLLLNTAMQTQADRIAATKQRLAATALRLQTLQVDVDRQGVPAVLAARAQALRLVPASRLQTLVLPRRSLSIPTGPTLSAAQRRALRLTARERAASRVHAG